MLCDLSSSLHYTALMRPTDCFDQDGALSRSFLLARGFCCGNGCKNCPYTPRHTRPKQPCPHRFYRAYEDGDGRWDLHCLECDAWPERDELHPCAVSCYEIDDEARSEFTENLIDSCQQVPRG